MPATVSAIRTSLDEVLNNTSAEDAFILISGHGLPGKIPVTTLGKDDSVSFAEIMKMAKNRRNKDKSIRFVLPACYSGSIADSLRKPSDFDAKVCWASSAGAMQMARIQEEPFQFRKKNPTLNNVFTDGYLGKPNDSTPQKSSDAYIESVIRELTKNMDELPPEFIHKKEKCTTETNEKLDSLSPIHLLFQNKQALKELDIYATQKFFADRICRAQVFLDLFPIKKKNFEKSLREISKETYQQFQNRKRNLVVPEPSFMELLSFLKNSLKKKNQIEEGTMEKTKARYSPEQLAAHKKIDALEDQLIDEMDEMKLSYTPESLSRVLKCQFDYAPQTLNLYLPYIGRNLTDDQMKDFLAGFDRTQQENKPLSPEILAQISKFLTPQKIYEFEGEPIWTEIFLNQEYTKNLALVRQDFESFLQTPKGQKYQSTYKSLLDCEKAPLIGTK